MKLHEHQAKALLASYGVAVPPNMVAFDRVEAMKVAEQLVEQTRNSTLVVKAQIHAGGRGKGRFKEDTELGGVKVVSGAHAAADVAERMLGKTLVTLQTGPEGKTVNRVLIEAGAEIKTELYLGAVLDRAAERVCVMGCSEGGVEIEEIAAKTPERIIKEWIDPAVGLRAYQARRLAMRLGLSGDTAQNATGFVLALAKAVVDEDASLAEINPLVVTQSDEVIALDAKIDLDDSASFRHPAWRDLRDTSEEDAAELEAGRHNLSYVKLDGSIGCMVNGAGLAMGTMDIIKQFGGEPANFLDVGGSADKDRVAAAMQIIQSDPNVKGIFVNIFGGIVFCDNVAQGIVDGVKTVGLKVPLVVRLEGTNVEAGRKILEASGLKLTAASDMADGARKIVELSQ